MKTLLPYFNPSPTCTCGGTGRIGHKTDGGYMTELCPCRMELPPRFGKAAWWACESLESLEFDNHNIEACGTIEREVPVSDDNYRLHRTEDNSYFQAGMRFEASAISATAESIREFAAWLLTVADRVEKADEPVGQP